MIELIRSHAHLLSCSCGHLASEGVCCGRRASAGRARLARKDLRHLVVWKTIIIEIAPGEPHWRGVVAACFVLAERRSAELVAVGLLEGKVLLCPEEVALILRHYLYLLGLLSQLFDESLAALVAYVVPVLCQNFLALQCFRARLKQICNIVLPYVLLFIRVVRIIVMGPKVFFEKTCNPNCQIGAINLVDPSRRVNLGSPRAVSEVQLLLEGSLARHRRHQLEEVLGIGDEFFAHRDGVVAILKVCQAYLAQKLVVSRAKRLRIHYHGEVVVLRDHFKQLEVLAQMRWHVRWLA